MGKPKFDRDGRGHVTQHGWVPGRYHDGPAVSPARQSSPIGLEEIVAAVSIAIVTAELMGWIDLVALAERLIDFVR